MKPNESYRLEALAVSAESFGDFIWDLETRGVNTQVILEGLATVFKEERKLVRERFLGRKI